MKIAIFPPLTARKIWALLSESERRSAFVLFGMMLVGMVLETLGVGLVIPAVALLTRPDFASGYPVLQPVLRLLGNPGQKELITGGLALMVVVYVVKGLFISRLIWLQMRFVFKVQSQLSQRLFNVYLRQPYAFHLQRNSAQLIRNVFNGVGVFSESAIYPLLMLLAEGLVFVGLAAILLWVEPLGTAVLVVVLGLMGGGFYRVVRSRVARWGEVRQIHEGLRIQHLQQGLGGVKDAKILGREQEFLDQYSSCSVKSARAVELQQTLMQLPRLWLEVFTVGGLATLVFVMTVQGRDSSTILITLSLFAAVSFRLMPSVNKLLSSLQNLQFGLPVVNTLYEEMLLPVQVADDCALPQTFKSSLELRQVAFTYSGEQAPAINGVTITIRRGESVALIGGSGSGKSTLVDILLGLLTPNDGEVRVDGINIQKHLRDWQNQIGYVPQSIFLTDDSLRRNVALGLADKDIQEAAVWRALRAAQLEEFVRSLPNGLDTQMGERGVRLSGGQRQRIGIARALYHDPAVLVLDEATSSLDVATERDVMQAVRALHGAKTIIIVAHRLSTVECCDRLYQLDQGRVVAEGTPGAVLSGNVNA